MKRRVALLALAPALTPATPPVVASQPPVAPRAFGTLTIKPLREAVAQRIRHRRVRQEVSRALPRRALLHPHYRVSAPTVDPVGEWDTVARCESTGDWSINTGNGFYGGLQIALSTWVGYGGLAYASRPDLASRDAQITVARRILAGQGWQAWPVCGRGVLG